MTYELALKLKKAGFPQTFLAKCKGIEVYYQEDGKSVGNIIEFEKTPEIFYEQHTSIENIVYFPTLEELIEACGEDFGSLYAGGELGWIADKAIHDLEQEGSTPSEAVANLWLKLNGKD